MWSETVQAVSNNVVPAVHTEILSLVRSVMGLERKAPVPAQVPGH